MNAIDINFMEEIQGMITTHSCVHNNVPRKKLIHEAVENREAMVTKNGALATWTPNHSTGRSPKDTYIVKNPESQANIDWTSPNNIPLDPETFNMVFEDAMETLSKKGKIYSSDRVIGAHSKYALPVNTVTDRALAQVFANNMFRPVPENINDSIFAQKGFTLIALPYDYLDRSKYQGKLRQMPSGETSNMCVVMDLDKRVGIVYGSAYLGSLKKLMFTVMNYYLPFEGILPLHCSANDENDGNAALLLGLSGTGKTTLSADPKRALLGDDEHGWSEDGIFNFENGCYAKMIDIDGEKEPEIYNAVMHKDDYLNHGSIIENAMMYPNGTLDYFDDRLTPNSRASYPLTFLTNIKESSISKHPNTILFLTADAYGVLPPISKLTKEQAMLWFLMGYTSKLAGTETGVTEPQATFSRFFGQPFMPCNPDIYASMLGEKMEKHNTQVFLINTGWSGGSYGTGSRIKLKYTRAMVNAAQHGMLNDVEFTSDELFHLNVPASCPDVPSEILSPINTWSNKEDYKATAQKLAEKFTEYFEKAYGKQNIDQSIINQCPGK